MLLSDSWRWWDLDGVDSWRFGFHDILDSPRSGACVTCLLRLASGVDQWTLILQLIMMGGALFCLFQLVKLKNPESRNPLVCCNGAQTGRWCVDSFIGVVCKYFFVFILDRFVFKMLFILPTLSLFVVCTRQRRSTLIAIAFNRGLERQARQIAHWLHCHWSHVSAILKLAFSFPTVENRLG